MIATISTIIIVLLFTGNLELSLGAGAVEFFIKMILYYLHERIWYKSNIGIINSEDRKRTD